MSLPLTVCTTAAQQLMLQCKELPSQSHRNKLFLCLVAATVDLQFNDLALPTDTSHGVLPTDTSH